MDALAGHRASHGRGPAVETAVLEDPTGRRRRRMRIAGGVLATLLTGWLLVLLLGGLGITPVADLPLAGPPAPLSPRRARRRRLRPAALHPHPPVPAAPPRPARTAPLRVRAGPHRARPTQRPSGATGSPKPCLDPPRAPLASAGESG